MVGRNDPCPCGSGKKYKRCCAGKKEVFLDDLIEQELSRILYNSFEVISKQVKFDDFETYTNSWKEEIGNLWDAQSIEEAVSAYYILISRSELWENYISAILNETLRSSVRDVVETWKKPIALLGSVIKEENGYLEIKELLGSQTYYMKENEKITLDSGAIVLGIVLPQEELHQKSVKIVSSIMGIKDENGDLKSAIKSFYEVNPAAQDTDFVEENMLDIYSILLGRPSATSKVEEVSPESEEVSPEPNEVSQEPSEVSTGSTEVSSESNEIDLTPIQNEAIEILNNVLETRNTSLDEKKLLESICTAYFINIQPNFRKANVVAAAAFITAIDLDLITEEPMTKTAAAKLFDVSPASVTGHVKNIHSFVVEDFLNK